MTRNNIVLLRTVFTKCITLFCFAVVVRRSELGGGYVPGAGGGGAQARLSGPGAKAHSRCGAPGAFPAYRPRAPRIAARASPACAGWRAYFAACACVGAHISPVVQIFRTVFSFFAACWSRAAASEPGWGGVERRLRWFRCTYNAFAALQRHISLQMPRPGTYNRQKMKYRVQIPARNQYPSKNVCVFAPEPA